MTSESIQFGTSNFIQANAGCGKTYALSGQYIALLLKGEDPACILASTFTRKAAAEIQERVFLRLLEALKNPSALKSQLPDFNINKKLLLETLDRLIRNLHKIQISTLDSFQSAITKLFAEELKLPFGWRIISSAEYELVTLDAISGLCSAIEADEMWFLVSTLKRGDGRRSISNTLLSALAFSLEGLDLASPGIWNWLQAQKPSAWPKEKFIEELIAIELPKTKAGAPNKNYLNAVQKISELLNASNHDGLLENGLLAAINEGSTDYSRAEIPSELISLGKKIFETSGAFSLAKLANANKIAGTLNNGFISELESLENRLGVLTFARITKKLLRLSDSLYSNEFYFRLDSQIKHLLLDEFQDTSLTQWILLKPLITEKLSDSTEDQSCFCVGDAKQSIYSWRGANAEIFNLIPKSWPDLNLGQLDTSYRSAPHIIEFINSVFAALSDREDLGDYRNSAEEWLSRFQKHKTVREDNGSEIYFEKVPEEFESENYLEKIFSRIAEWRRYNPESSVGILVRTNDQLGTIAEFAKSRKTDISSEGGKPLSSFSVINCLIAILKHLNNPHDKISRFLAEKSGLSKGLSFGALIEQVQALLEEKGLSETLKVLALNISSECSALELTAIDKLIQAAISFESSGSLRQVENFFRLVNATSIEESGLSQIKLMTMHKAKGLEFDLCVIADLSFKLTPDDKHDILIEEDPESLLPVRVSLPGNKGIRACSEELSRMAKSANNKEFHEALNILYVAISRARKDLFLFCPEKALTGSSFNSAKLCSSVIEPVLNDSLPELIGSVAETASAETLQPTFSNIQISENKLRGLASLSATSTTKQTFSQQENPEALELGTLVHFLFSKLKWIDELQSDLKGQLSSVNKNQQLVDKAINIFLSSLKLPSVYAVFDKSLWPDCEVLTEKPFIFREGNCLLEGRIDRLIVSPSQITIVDFKLGKKPEDSDKMAGYINQQEIYKKGASLLYPGRKVECQILFLADR